MMLDEEAIADTEAATRKTVEPEIERVPLFGTWPRAYVIVLGLFGAEVALLYAFTRFFS